MCLVYCRSCGARSVNQSNCNCEIEIWILCTPCAKGGIEERCQSNVLLLNGTKNKPHPFLLPKESDLQVMKTTDYMSCEETAEKSTCHGYVSSPYVGSITFICDCGNEFCFCFVNCIDVKKLNKCRVNNYLFCFILQPIKYLCCT